MKIVLSLILFCLFACTSSLHKARQVDLEQIQILNIKADTTSIAEIQNPLAMYELGEYILFPHSEKTAESPLYFYSKKDLSFCFSWGKFGRGPGEIYDCNPYYFQKTDSSFILNTNYIYETDFKMKGDSLEMETPKLIASLPMNNLLKINDSIFFFENKLEEKEFSLYNTKRHATIKKFGEYPQTVILFDEPSDRDNICQKSCILNRDKGLIYVFYENMPLIRMYSITGNLLEEVTLKDTRPKKITVPEFYESKSDLYFSFPYCSGNSIYVQFFNVPLNKVYTLEQVELQEWDEELNLKNRFLIDRNFNIFCIATGSIPMLYGFNQREGDAYFIKAKLRD